MEICNHFIQRKEIIGIGPLMVHKAPGVEQLMYKSRQLFFWMHLKNHSVKIESDWFDLEPIIDTEGKNKAQYEAFKKTYNEVLKDIKEMVEKADSINTQQ